MRRFRLVERCPKPKIDTGCTFCKVEIPSDLSLTDEVNNTKVLPWKHVLILSHGFKDFTTMPAKIEMAPGLSNEISRLRRTILSAYHPILVSNIILENYTDERLDTSNQLVYVYPDNKRVEFPLGDTANFMRKYLVPQNNQSEEVYNPFKQRTKQLTTESIDATRLKENDLAHKIILVCGHTSRDLRCGILAPPILEEFGRIVDAEQYRIGAVSHIGGHAYAGNVIAYPENIWYGRVTPEKVQGVYETLTQNQIIKELYRGDPSEIKEGTF